MRIGLCGLGTVGTAFLAALAKAREDGRAPPAVELVACASRRGRDGVDPGLFAPFAGVQVGADVMELACRSDLDVVVELIGGTDTAAEIAQAVLGGGRCLITANKALLADQGDRILAWQSSAEGAALYAEAAVAGAVPAVRTLADLSRGDSITGITGILNGTCNFILTRMEGGADYAAALREAQEGGFAEADPSMDVEGWDALQKICILASIAFGSQLPVLGVRPGGIVQLEPLDFAMAGELGCRIRHLARASRLDRKVGVGAELAMVPQGGAFAHVLRETNALSVQGPSVREITLTGPGAGGAATAAAVLSDLLAAAEGRASEALFARRDGGPPVGDLSGVVERRYLRLRLEDRPGVMAGLSALLAKHGSNIEELLQRPLEGEEGLALAVAVLSPCDGPTLQKILRDLEAFSGKAGAILHMPILGS